MVHQNEHYRQSQERGTPAYKVEMKLTITNAGLEHFGKYTCVAKNPRGQTDGAITLYAREPPTTTPAPTTPSTTSTTLLTYKVDLPRTDINKDDIEGQDLREKDGTKR